jgi:hypothetical protein
MSDPVEIRDLTHAMEIMTKLDEKIIELRNELKVFTKFRRDIQFTIRQMRRIEERSDDEAAPKSGSA